MEKKEAQQIWTKTYKTDRGFRAMVRRRIGANPAEKCTALSVEEELDEIFEYLWSAHTAWMARDPIQTTYLEL